MDDAHYLAQTGSGDRPAPFFNARKLFRKRSMSAAAMRAADDERDVRSRASLGSARRPSVVAQDTIDEVPARTQEAQTLRRKASRPRTASGLKHDPPPPVPPSSSTITKKSSRPQSAPIDKGQFLSSLADSDATVGTSSRRPSIASTRPDSGDIPPKLNAKLSSRRSTREPKPMVAGPESFIVFNGQRHHPFSRFVPYPRSYHSSALDSDVWNSMFMSRAARGLTCHKFEPPPEKVLDIGCGSGFWLIQSASVWKDSHFTGVDVVPLQPLLAPADPFLPSVTPRITWIKANVLEGLPFPSNSFDFVRVSRIAGGIDEKKWDDFLEDIVRVLKPCGAFEMIDEDIFFPGKHRDAPDFMPESSLLSAPTPVPSVTSFDRPSAADIEAQFEDLPPEHSVLAVPGVAWSSFASFSAAGTAAEPEERRSSVAHTAPAPPVNPRNHSVLEAIWTEMHADRFINLYPLSLLANSIPIYFEDMRTHAPITYFFPSAGAKPPPEPCEDAEKGGDKRARSTSASGRSEQLPAGPLDPSPGSESLHLRLRVADVLVCTETMWDWVLKFQADCMPADASAVQRAVGEMKRVDYDRLLSYFKYDMGDRIASGHALQGWGDVTGDVTDDRRAYDKAVLEWDEYMESLNEDEPPSNVNQDPWGPAGTDRISRTIRVFCAWKGNAPTLALSDTQDTP